MPRHSFIQRLTTDLTPVRSTSFRRFFLSWLVSSVCIALFFTYAVSFRADLLLKLAMPGYIAGFVLLSLLYLTGSYFAITTALPGEDTARRPMLILLVLTGLYGVALLLRAQWPNSNVNFAEPSLSEAFWCSARIGFGSSLIGLVFLALLARFTLFNLKWSVAFGLFASTVLVAMVSHAHCEIDDFWHLFIGHGLGVGAPMSLVYGIHRLMASRLTITPRKKNSLFSKR